MIKKLIVSITLIAASVFLISPLALADNPAKCSIQQGANAAAQVDQSCGTPSGAPTDLSNLVANIIDILSIAVGAVAVVMLIYGGFKYVTSGGAQEAITSARKTITYAIVGLIIVAVAQIIVQFTLNKSNDAISGNTSGSSSSGSGCPNGKLVC